MNIENNDFFEIERIDISGDPEIPEWKPLLIRLDIYSDDFDKRLKLKHIVIKKAFENIDADSRKHIFISGAI